MLPLQHIAFEITDRCNLDCIYCYNIWKTGKVKHVPFNSYNKAIATLEKLFEQAAVKNVAFTGGEPLLAERITEVILFCRMQGKSVTLITNGNAGTKKEYRKLLKMGVGLFEIPIHSAKTEIHDQMTQISGSWHKSVESVKNILELGGYVVPVVVITKQNASELGNTLEYIHHLGCKRMMLNRYNIGGKGCQNPLDISADAQTLRHAFSIANGKAEELGLKLTSNVCSPTCLLNPADYPLIGFGHCSFNVLQRPITLDINGNIRVCNHSPVVAGNIFETSLTDILYSDYTQSWATSVPEVCKNCEHWFTCKGSCRAASEQCLETLSTEDPIIKVLGI